MRHLEREENGRPMKGVGRSRPGAARSVRAVSIKPNL